VIIHRTANYCNAHTSTVVSSIQGEVALHVGLEIAAATWSTISVILTPPHTSPVVTLGVSLSASTDAAARNK
jgi:hypothetical protein